MADPKGDKLYVNLSASQTRKRLKGFGHGVRKIQSAGKNQAVIIHTATGRHLEELAAKFADMGCSAIESDLSEPTENLCNLGRTIGAIGQAGWERTVFRLTIAVARRQDLTSMFDDFILMPARQVCPNARFNVPINSPFPPKGFHHARPSSLFEKRCRRHVRVSSPIYLRCRRSERQP